MTNTTLSYLHCHIQLTLCLARYLSRVYSIRYIYDIRLRTLWCDSERRQRSSGTDPIRWVNAVDRLPIYITTVQTKHISVLIANAIDSPHKSVVYFMSPRQPDDVCGCCCWLCRLIELTNWCGPRVKLNSSACLPVWWSLVVLSCWERREARASRYKRCCRLLARHASLDTMSVFLENVYDARGNRDLTL